MPPVLLWGEGGGCLELKGLRRGPLGVENLIPHHVLIGADEAHLGPGRLLQHILEEIGAPFSDGHKFIPMAREKGAACVLCQKAPQDGPSRRCRWRRPPS